MSRKSKNKKGKLLRVQRHRCFHCGQKISFDEATFEHVIPKSEGGTLRNSNIVVAHEVCNSDRGNRPFSEIEIDKAYAIQRVAFFGFKGSVEIAFRNRRFSKLRKYIFNNIPL